MSTKIKILDAAQCLFAAKGFNATSLREITTHANVNLAAVNYHFGSKKELIKAVMSRFMDAISPTIAKELDAMLNAEAQPDLTAAFDVFVKPLLSLDKFQPNGTHIFLQLLGHGYFEGQGFLRWFLTTTYPEVISNFSEVVRRACPQLTQEELFWRLHFTMGTVVFSMSSSEALADIAANDFEQSHGLNRLLEQIIPFLVAGVNAPSAR